MKSGKVLDMRCTTFCNDPNELWERIEYLFIPVKLKRNYSSRKYSQDIILVEILYKY